MYVSTNYWQKKTHFFKYLIYLGIDILMYGIK